MLMQQRRHRNRVGDDPGDVRRGRERADQGAAVGMADQLAFEVVEADVSIGVLIDDHHIGDRLAPWQLVRVMFERADEHHGPIVGRDRFDQVVPVVERRRNPQAEHPEQLGDRVRRSTAAEHHGVFVAGGPDAPFDDGAGLLAHAGGLQSGPRRLGVGVGVERQHDTADVVLDEAERPPRRRVVGVDDGSRAVGPVDHVVASDHRIAHRSDQIVGGGVG